MNPYRTFPAKIFLFGEYSVLSGSRALALPLHRWSGRFQHSEGHIDKDLVKLSQYLDAKELFNAAQRASFRQAVETGLIFQSEIPTGYGVGSSGALTAAVYDAFFRQANMSMDVTREHLAAIESHFHGKSSGMDPLVSLLNSAVLREAGRDHIVNTFRWPEGIRCFLLDSGQVRQSEHLITQYRAWCAEEFFQIHCLRPLVSANDHAIAFLIEDEPDMFWANLKLISMVQMQFFSPMITDSITDTWRKSLDHPGITIKLCGAGGGGYYLGFVREGYEIKELTDKAILLNFS